MMSISVPYRVFALKQKTVHQRMHLLFGHILLMQAWQIETSTVFEGEM